MTAIILLCIAVLLVSAPLPGPYANWAAFALALIALLLVCLGHASFAVHA